MGLPAARLTDMHVCPMVTGVVPHVGGPIIGPGSPNVFTGGLPQARATDMCVCVGPPDPILPGATTVFINNLLAARLGDMTAHGGNIILGLPTVLIGANGGGGGGGGGPADGPIEDERRVSVEYEFFKPADGPIEDERRVSVEYEFFKAEEHELKRIGNKDDFLRFGSADADAQAVAGYDLDKKQFSAGINAEASIAAVKGHAKGSLGNGAISGEAEGEALSASGTLEAGITAGKDGVEAKAAAGGELVLVKGKVSGEIRVTPKSLYDNTIGRLTNTVLSKAWDKGVVIGASGEGGVGAAAKAEAEFVANAHEISATASATAGAGLTLGLALKFSLIW